MKIVKSQDALEKALATGEQVFRIDGFRAELRGNSHAELCGNSHAVLWENSHAVLWENSRAELRENSHAELWGNSHAVLRENSHAVLRGNSRAVGKDFACIHILSEKAVARRSSRVVIIKPLFPSSITEWCEIKDIRIKDGRMRLWKATREDGMDFYSGKIQYNSTKEIICPDWKDDYDMECGHGLHLADSPSAARYFVDSSRPFRLFEMSAHIDDCVCSPCQPYYPMKIRVKKCWMLKEHPPDYLEEL